MSDLRQAVMLAIPKKISTDINTDDVGQMVNFLTGFLDNLNQTMRAQGAGQDVLMFLQTLAMEHLAKESRKELKKLFTAEQMDHFEKISKELEVIAEEKAEKPMHTPWHSPSGTRH